MTDNEWKVKQVEKRILDRAAHREAFMLLHGSDQHPLERWDCGCSFGCNSCSITHRCSICGHLFSGEITMDWNSPINAPLSLAELALRAKKLRGRFGKSFEARTIMPHTRNTVEILVNGIVVGTAERVHKKGNKKYWRILP